MSLIQLFSAQPWFEQMWVERLGWTLIHFLWQGALIAAIYPIARRSRSTQIRYLLACLALAAMTIAPIVTFAAIGTSESSQTATTIQISPAHAEIAPAPIPVFIAETRHDNLMSWLVIAWLAGAIIFWTRLTAGWIVAARMRSILVRPAPAEWQHKLDRLKTRIRISQPVRLLTSALVQVPTVVGWLRPIVLMPIGALAGLPIEHIEALLAHELAHIRRHDYLINILQSAAEALLFYHPAVWWISSQISNERELCCDDVAVAISGDALIYARALADLEQYRPAHHSPALAANGGSLADRIARLLGQSRKSPRTMPGPGIILAAALLVITAYGLFAQQSPAPRSSFEAASLRLEDPHIPPEFFNNDPRANQPTIYPANRLTMRNAQVKGLICQAFDVRCNYIQGAPDWLERDHYYLSAKLEGNTRLTREQMRPLLRNLLEERFHLKVHHEQKIVPGYELIVAKGGPRLQLNNGAPFMGMDGGFALKWQNVSVEYFATQVLEHSVKQPIVDRTGIKGMYDFDLKFAPQDSPWIDPSHYANFPDIFTVLQKQYGLRLVPRKVTVDALVIDHIDRVPVEN